MELVFLAPLLLSVGLVALALGGGGGTEDDTPRAVDGTDGDDTLSGTGNDIVSGFDGDDVLDGEGSSRLLGGGGDDVLVAEDRVRALGGEGRDTLTGSGRDVVLRGETEGDTMTASDRATAFGGAGNDRIKVSTGATGFGGGADDLMFVTTPDSSASGEEGRDYMVVEEGRADGGTEDDWLSVGDGTAAGRVTGIGGEGNDIFALRDRAEAEGGIGADTFIGVVEEPLFEGEPQSEVVITDFQRVADRLLISVAAPVDSYDISQDGPDTVVTVITAATGPGDTGEGLVIRILGVTGLTAADIGVVTDMTETEERGVDMGIRFGVETPLGP